MARDCPNSAPDKCFKVRHLFQAPTTKKAEKATKPSSDADADADADDIDDTDAIMAEFENELYDHELGESNPGPQQTR